jgi:hypothetical protein
VQGAQVSPAHYCVFGGSSRAAGVVEAQVDQGVEARVSGLYAVDEGLDDLDWR